MEGEGVLIYLDSSGRKFEGSFLENKKHGYGIFSWDNEKTVYEGTQLLVNNK